MVMDDFSCLMKMASQVGFIVGFSFSKSVSISHSLFVDDMLIFGRLVRNHWFYVHFIFIQYFAATGLCVNKEKSFLMFEFGVVGEISFIFDFLGVQFRPSVKGFLYLGYRIKPCGYKVKD